MNQDVSNQNVNTSTANPVSSNLSAIIDIQDPADLMTSPPAIKTVDQSPANSQDQTVAPKTQVEPVENIQEIVEAKHKEEDEIEQVLTELKTTDINQLSQKYKADDLSKKVCEKRPITFRNVVDALVLERHLFISDFIEPGMIKNITELVKEKILGFIANLNQADNNQTILSQLELIGPGLVLPGNFKKENYQPQAQELWQATQNIKIIIAQISVNEYFGDVLNFIKLPDDKFLEIKTKIDDLVVKMTREYQEKLLKEQEPSPLLFDEGFEILRRVGRTPIYIQSLREEHNFGDLTDIISKVQFALTIAEQINPKKQNLASENDVLEETKKLLIGKIVLN